ncbi:MAG: CBS domain-containing protein, partial [Deltaproteobacteria bacterium]
LDALAAEALQKMEQHSITSLFVMDGEKVAGVVHLHDLLKAWVV